MTIKITIKSEGKSAANGVLAIRTENGSKVDRQDVSLAVDSEVELEVPDDASVKLEIGTHSE